MVRPIANRTKGICWFFLKKNQNNFSSKFNF